MKALCTILFFTAISFSTIAQIQPIQYGLYKFNSNTIKKDKGRESSIMLQGSTPELQWLKIHVTTQYANAIPKPANAQDSLEELIIIKEGKLKCTLNNTTQILSAGSVLLIPPKTIQQLQNASNQKPVTYYVLQYRSAITAQNIANSNAIIVNADTVNCSKKNNKERCAYFEQPTTMCKNYEMHITKLYQKGASHAGHQHIDTEIILVIDGEVEMTIDNQYYKGTTGDIFIATPNIMHQVGNASEKSCSYFAFKWR